MGISKRGAQRQDPRRPVGAALSHRAGDTETGLRASSPRPCRASGTVGRGGPGLLPLCPAHCPGWSLLPDPATWHGPSSPAHPTVGAIFPSPSSEGASPAHLPWLPLPVSAPSPDSKGLGDWPVHRRLCAPCPLLAPLAQSWGPLAALPAPSPGPGIPALARQGPGPLLGKAPLQGHVGCSSPSSSQPKGRFLLDPSEQPLPPPAPLPIRPPSPDLRVRSASLPGPRLPEAEPTSEGNPFRRWRESG